MYFSRNKLIKCGKYLANLHSLPVPADEIFIAKIDEILIKRESYNGALDGIITKEEMATLVLQHFQTLLCHNAGISESTLTKEWDELVALTIEALFVNENL